MSALGRCQCGAAAFAGKSAGKGDGFGWARFVGSSRGSGPEFRTTWPTMDGETRPDHVVQTGAGGLRVNLEMPSLRSKLIRREKNLNLNGAN